MSEMPSFGRKRMKIIIKLITTVCCIGFIPRIPGTAASLLATGLVFYFTNLGHKYKIFLLLLIAVSGAFGFALCGKAEKIFGKKDASPIVIDEFFAMLTTLIFIKPTTFFLAVTFIIFRAMDILKFWPIKRIEKLGGSKGVMLDDCLAGFYSVIIVHGIMRLINFYSNSF